MYIQCYMWNASCGANGDSISCAAQKVVSCKYRNTIVRRGQALFAPVYACNSCSVSTHFLQTVSFLFSFLSSSQLIPHHRQQHITLVSSGSLTENLVSYFATDYQRVQSGSGQAIEQFSALRDPHQFFSCTQNLRPQQSQD